MQSRLRKRKVQSDPAERMHYIDCPDHEERHLYMNKKEAYKNYLQNCSVEVYAKNSTFLEYKSAKFIGPDSGADSTVYMLDEYTIFDEDYNPAVDAVIPSQSSVKWRHPESLTPAEKVIWDSVTEALMNIKPELAPPQPATLPSSPQTHRIWQSETVTGRKSEKGCLSVGISDYFRQFQEMWTSLQQGELNHIPPLDALSRQFLRRYHNKVSFLLEAAFCDNMQNSTAKSAISAMMDLAADLTGGDKLWIHQHGGSPHDDHAFRVVILDPATQQENRLLESSELQTSTSPSSKQEQSTTKPSSSPSVTCDSSPATVEKDADAFSRVHSDVTVLSVSGDMANPILVVDIQPANCLDENQMIKCMLGVLQTRNEAFGITINALEAKIYRMVKTEINGLHMLRFSSKPYKFLRKYSENFSAQAIIDLLKDILQILQHGLQN